MRPRAQKWRDSVRAALDAAHVTLSRPTWYEITNQAADTADVYVYDEIGMWGQTAADFVRDLAAVSARNINCYINSPGGEIFDGIAIYNSLKAHPAEVTVYVDSLAASIASVIAMAGDKIFMRQGSQMMIHDGAGLCLGNAEDMRAMAELLDRQSDNIAGFYAARAGGTAKQWRTRMQAETWYTAEEAVAAGLADKVAADTVPARPAPPSGAAMDNRWDLSVYRYAGREQAPAPAAARPPAPTNRAFPATDPAPEIPPALVPAPTPNGPAPANVADDEPVWSAELAEAFRAAMRDEPDDDVIAVLREAGLAPKPPEQEPDVYIDPAEFYNAVREGTRQ